MSYATTKQQLMYLTIIFFYKISELLMRELYYHPDCLANILCFHDLAEKKLVTFDANNNEFLVKIQNKEYKFKPKGKLYVYNARPKKETIA